MVNFIERHAEKIAGVLSCLDRVVITGTLPDICHAEAATRYLFNHKIRKEHSESAGPLERDSSAHNRSTIIVVSRHLRDTGNDYGEAQTQAEAQTRGSPSATARSARGDPGRDPRRPTADRGPTPRRTRDPHPRGSHEVGTDDRGIDRPTGRPPAGRGHASGARRPGEPASGPLLGSRGGPHTQGSRATRRHAADGKRTGDDPRDLFQPQLPS